MTWVKSSSCSTDRGCVEVKTADYGVTIRGSENPEKRLFFTPDEWATFIAGIKAGQFDIVDVITRSAPQ